MARTDVALPVYMMQRDGEYQSALGHSFVLMSIKCFIHRTKHLRNGFKHWCSQLGRSAMLNFLGCSAHGIAIANGVTTLALLELRSGS